MFQPRGFLSHNTKDNCYFFHVRVNVFTYNLETKLFQTESPGCAFNAGLS